MKKGCLSILTILALMTSGCAAPASISTGSDTKQKILAVESFLADITQHVAGDRWDVSSLIPPGVDPHAFEPAPSDIALISESDIIIINGGGLESWLEKTFAALGDQKSIITACAGLISRKPQESETIGQTGSNPNVHNQDPHFWLDPILTIRYIENIRDGLILADPKGKDQYEYNAREYIAQLKDLDKWITDQVGQIPPDRRLLVTNHESFGYFADRYGFRIIGTLLPSSSSLAAPSAQNIAQLIEVIQAKQVRAIFLETGSNADLADQIANETGARVIGSLYTHSLSTPKGPAPNYISMMRFDTLTIVDALK